MNEYAESLLVQNELQNKGRMELDRAVFSSDSMAQELDSQIERQKKMLASLKRARTENYSNLDEIRDTLKRVKDDQPQTDKFVYEYKAIETPKIYTNWEQSVEENRRFAKDLGLDLSHPLSDMFSNIEFADLSPRLIEQFGSLLLDKYDYAFATCCGIISGIVDAVFVGTIGKDSTGSKLQKSADELMKKLVQAYARLNGWSGDNTNSAIRYLEEAGVVPYDARYDQDLKLNSPTGLNPNNHHLRSLAHSPSILGLIVGIFDIINQTTTLYIPGKGIKVLQKTNSNTDGLPSYNIFSVAHTWLNHIMSDIAGASGSKGRGAGLPAPLFNIFQQFQIGNFSIDGKSYTVGGLAELLYTNGYDFRSFTAQAVPVLLNESLIRCYWFCKQHFFFGKEAKESLACISTKKTRELERLSFVAASTFSGIDIAHAAGHTAVKAATSQKPMRELECLLTFLLTLNYVQMADFGYHMYMNVKLEYQHGKEVREWLKTEGKREWEELCSS